MKTRLLIVLSLFSFFLFFQAQTASGQQPQIFKHLTVENGLSSGSVLSITQDMKGFIWAGTMDGLNRFDGKKVKIFKSFYANNPIGTSVKFSQLVADKQYNVWIGTNNGLYVYDIRLDSFNVFYHSDQNKNSITHNNIKALFLDRSGNVWVGTQNGLSKIVYGKDKNFSFQTILVNHDVHAVFETSRGNILVGTADGIVTLLNNASTTASLKGINITAITEDKRQTIWIGTTGLGLYKMSRDGVTEKNYSYQAGQKTGLVNNNIRKIILDKRGELWIGTLKGLSVLDPLSETFKTFVHDPENPHSLNFNSIYDIFEDRQGTIWVGTYFGGLNIVEALRTVFTIYANKREDGISSNVIQPIIGDEYNSLWIGTEAEGLNYFDRQKKVFKRFKYGQVANASISSNLVKALLKDKYGRIWIGMHDGGVNVIDKSGKRLLQFDGNGVNRINSDDVAALLHDHTDRIWIGTEENGINIYDLQTGIVDSFSSLYPGNKLPDNGITCFFEDSKRNIWIGTGHGLGMLEFSKNKLFSFLKKDFPDQLQSDFIHCVNEDKKGTIWIGTYMGLLEFDPYTSKFRSYTVKEGLAGNKVVGIVPDNNNNLWISTNNGLSRFDSTRSQFVSFNVFDGLPGNVFNYNSFFRDTGGHIFFGGYKGLVEFSPKEIEMNKESPSILLTGISLNGNLINTRQGLLTKDISETEKIKLKHFQNVFSIDYAVMNFIKPEKNKSAYKLKGYDMDWVYTDAHAASFTNVPPGDYALLVKGSNNDGIWTSEQKMLAITIMPPPWKSWWAYTLYAIAFVLLATVIIYFFASRAALRRKLRYEQLLNAKQKELHQMKIDFFTHMSHEIRTPLSLILGPVEMLSKSIPAKSSGQKLLQTIKGNAERLLKLTTDLLDFRKADAGYTQLKITAENIVSFCRSVYEKFTEAAGKKSIEYNFNSNEDEIEVYFDHDHLEIVITNLLSNALKFTPVGGQIDVFVERIRRDKVEIRVCDNGVGIPLEGQDKIFTSFYQANTGTLKDGGSGIGLAFSKSLVELHKGKLSFTSTEKPGSDLRETCFIVTLLLGKDHFDDSGFTIK